MAEKDGHKTIYVGQPSSYKVRQAIQDSLSDPERARNGTQAYVDEMEDAMGVLEASIADDTAPLEGEVMTAEDLAPVKTGDGDQVRQSDPSLTEAEKRLSRQQLEFCVNYAKTQNGGRSAVAAGYAKSSSRVMASRLLKNPDVISVIRSRMPAEKRLEGLTKDWVLDNLVSITQRSLQDVPVMGNDGYPSGYYSYDAMTALRALDQIAGIMGLKKDSLEVSAKNGGGDEKPEGREVKLGILSIADRIRRDGLKRKDEK